MKKNIFKAWMVSSAFMIFIINTTASYAEVKVNRTHDPMCPAVVNSFFPCRHMQDKCKFLDVLPCNEFVIY